MMRLTRAGLALPVRMAANSSLATSMALAIFDSHSCSVSSIMSALSSLAGPLHLRDGPDQRPDRLPADRPPDVPLGEQVEHDDRQIVVHTQRQRGGVHDLEFPADRLEVVEAQELAGFGMPLGI